MVKLSSSNINIIMAQYIVEPKKTLKKWVKPFVKIENIVNFEYHFSRNIDMISKYKLSISDSIMAKLIIKKYPDVIDWNYLSKNTNKWVYKLLKNNPDKINWNYLSENPSGLLNY